MLTADQAAEIAHKHGLTLHDAASLRALADDEETATRIAERFARTAPKDDANAMRAYTRAIFNNDES